jgi:hypothetical protein
MRSAKRATFYLEPKVARLLRKEASRTERTMSDLVNETLKRSFDEDAYDLALARSRAHERAIPFPQAVRKLKRSGRL